MGTPRSLDDPERLASAFAGRHNFERTTLNNESTMPAATAPRCARSLLALSLATTFAWLPAGAHAQEGPPPLSSVSVAGVARLDASIDGGGDFSANGIIVKGSFGRAFGPSFTAALTLSYAYEDWNFGTPNAFGKAAPWTTLNVPTIGANFNYRYSNQLALFVSPQVGWNYESGASTDNSMSYGAAFGAIYNYSPTLTLGLGAAAFRQVNRTNIFPFVIVNWKITDKWTLSNPLEAGPTGGPGVELAYAFNDNWELGAGVAFRDIRFRLKDDGPQPDGIGEDKGIPLFAHLEYTPTKALKIDFYAGAILNGRLKVLDSNGSTVTSSDYGTQPVLGIRASYAF